MKSALAGSSAPVYPSAAPQMHFSSQNNGSTAMAFQDIQVRVPDGLVAGQQFVVDCNGTPVALTVPQGYTPGQILSAKVQIPALPIATAVSPGGQQVPTALMPQHIYPGGAFPSHLGVPATMSRQDGPPLEGRLADLYGFEIFQVFHGIELAGCEKANRYNIHEMLHPTGVKAPNANADAVGPHIFLAQEVNTDCMERQCCGPQRSCNIRFHAGNTNAHHVYATFAKNFHLSGCCCFMRASAKMLDANHTVIADLYDPFYCCDWNIKVRDNQGNLIYFVTGPCCQVGVCIPCVDFVFEIREAGTNRVVGNVVKKFNGCSELATQTNRFRLTFPRDIPVNHKIALLGALFVLDFEYFEKKD